MANNALNIVIGSNHSQATAGLDAVGGSLRSLRTQTNDLSQSMGTLTQVIGAGGLVYALSSCMEASVQTERALVGLAVTARFSGAGMAQAQSAAQRLAKDGLMSVTEASQALQNLLSRGFSLDEAVAMMNRLKDSAAFNRQAHLEFGQSIVGATEGLKNENSVLVDNAGVTKNVSVMWKEYAREHNKSVEELTQSEKRHAEYNGIMRETEGQIGNAARMVNTYAGAQARLNQQMFEAKSTLGTALQPVLKATMDLLTPIVRGFRDIVYWIETLGPRAGATIDKLMIAKDIALSGKSPFFGAGAREYATRTAPINALLDEAIADIVQRSLGETLPDVGADSGKRRKDIVMPPKPKKAKEASFTTSSGGIYGWRADQKAEEEEAKWLKQRGDKVYNVNDILPSDQKKFDDSASLATWASRRAANDEAELTAEFDHGQKILGIRAQIAVATFSQQGLEIEAIQAKYDTEQQLADDRLQWTLDNTILEESEKSRIIETYQAEGEQREMERKQRLLTAHEELKQKELNISLNTLSATGSLLDAFNTATNNKNKTAFRIFQGIKAGETIISTYSAVMKAWDDPQDQNYYSRAAKAAAVAAAGIAAVSKIYSASSSGGGTVSAIGSTLGGSANVYGPGGQMVTQPTNGTNGVPLQVTIHVEGNVVAEDRWVEERLAPVIRDLATRRNVDFGLATN